MSKQVLTDLDFNNVSRIINLPDAVSNQSPVTLAQLNSAIEGLAWKDSVRVATQSNINLSSPGSTIDGITMATNDRVLVFNQSTASQNGIYIWNGSATPMTRALDASTSAELEQAVVTVEEGTSAGTSYRQTAINFTLDSGSITWTTFGTSAGAASTSSAGIAQIATQSEVNTGTDANKYVTPATLSSWTGRIRKYSTSIGDGSATSYTVTHNLDSRDCQVTVYRNSGSYDEVLVDVNRATTNTVSIVFASAPASNAFRVVVIS